MCTATPCSGTQTCAPAKLPSLAKNSGVAVEQARGSLGSSRRPLLTRSVKSTPIAAVDVDPRVRAGGAGVHVESAYSVVLALVERLRERLEHPRALVEGQRPQCRPAHPARVVQHRRDVRPSARERGDLCAVHRAVQRAPTAAANPLTDGVALQRHRAHGLHPRSAGQGVVRAIEGHEEVIVVDAGDHVAGDPGLREHGAEAGGDPHLVERGRAGQRDPRRRERRVEPGGARLLLRDDDRDALVLVQRHHGVQVGGHGGHGGPQVGAGMPDRPALELTEAPPARREAVAGLQALGETQLLELAHVALERLRVEALRRGRDPAHALRAARRSRRGPPPSTARSRWPRPSARAAWRSRRRPPPSRSRVGRQRGARVRLRHEVERDPVHRQPGILRQSPAHRVRRRRPGRLRIRLPDPGRIDDLDALDFDDPHRPVPMPHHHLRPPPPPERDRDRPLRQPLPSVLAEQHPASVPPARPRRGAPAAREAA